MTVSVTRVVYVNGETHPDEFVGTFASVEEVEGRFGVELRPLGGGKYTGTDAARGTTYVVQEN